MKSSQTQSNIQRSIHPDAQRTISEISQVSSTFHPPLTRCETQIKESQGIEQPKWSRVTTEFNPRPTHHHCRNNRDTEIHSKSSDAKATKHQKSSQQEMLFSPKAKKQRRVEQWRICFLEEIQSLAPRSTRHTRHKIYLTPQRWNRRWCQVKMRFWPRPALLKSSDGIEIRSKKWTRSRHHHKQQKMGIKRKERQGKGRLLDRACVRKPTPRPLEIGSALDENASSRSRFSEQQAVPYAMQGKRYDFISQVNARFCHHRMSPESSKVKTKFHRSHKYDSDDPSNMIAAKHPKSSEIESTRNKSPTLSHSKNQGKSSDRRTKINKNEIPTSADSHNQINARHQRWRNKIPTSARSLVQLRLSWQDLPSP